MTATWQGSEMYAQHGFAAGLRDTSGRQSLGSSLCVFAPLLQASEAAADETINPWYFIRPSLPPLPSHGF